MFKLYRVDSPLKETTLAIFDVIEEIGEFKGAVVEELPMHFAVHLRYSQSKSAWRRKLSQEIRAALELAPGTDADHVFVSIHAQGGDSDGAGSWRGIEQIRDALKTRVKVTPLPFEMGADEFSKRLNFGLEMSVITKLVEEHGHEFVRSNDPAMYEIWVQARDNKLSAEETRKRLMGG